MYEAHHRKVNLNPPDADLQPTYTTAYVARHEVIVPPTWRVKRAPISGALLTGPEGRVDGSSSAMLMGEYVARLADAARQNKAAPDVTPNEQP